MTEDTRTIPELLTALAQARAQAAQAQAELEAMYAQLKATGEYRAAEFGRKLASSIADALTATIKTRAAAGFDGENKKPFPGVNIQEKTVVTCTDPDALRSYALEHYPGYFTLDLERMKALAKQLAGTPHALPYFTVEKQPAATIAPDLSVYLPQPEKEDGVPF